MCQTVALGVSSTAVGFCLSCSEPILCILIPPIIPHLASISWLMPSYSSQIFLQGMILSELLVACDVGWCLESHNVYLCVLEIHWTVICDLREVAHPTTLLGPLHWDKVILGADTPVIILGSIICSVDPIRISWPPTSATIGTLSFSPALTDRCTSTLHKRAKHCCSSIGQNCLPSASTWSTLPLHCPLLGSSVCILHGWTCWGQTTLLDLTVYLARHWHSMHRRILRQKSV